MSQATSKAHWIFGERFLEEEFHGEMMGKPFTGRCLLGFDNTKQKFNSVWIDDMSTGMTSGEGTADASGKVITYTGQEICPQDGKMRPFRQVMTIQDDDHMQFEMYSHTSDGKEFKPMQTNYTRVK